DAGEHPAIATTPELFAALLVAALEETAVAEVEGFKRVVEEVRRRPELRHREVRVARIAGLSREFDPRRWRHEQRVTPAPAAQAGRRFVVFADHEAQMIDGRFGEDGIESGAYWGDRF